MKLMTASRARCARLCQRLHKLQYEDGYRPVIESHALRFGTLVHAGLEAWWTLRSMGVAGDDLLQRALARLREDESDPFDLVRAEELLRGYHYRWHDEPLEVLAVEVAFETELLNPDTSASSRTWRLAGKIDAIVRNLDTGLVYVVEHKTASDDITPGSNYWKRLRLDGQVSIYFAGAAALGHEVAGCLYDVLGKPALKPLKATPVEARKFTKDGKLYATQRETDETPEEYRARVNAAIAENPARYFQRGEVFRIGQEMEEAMADLWQLSQQLRESELKGRAPRNVDACTRFGSTCHFFGVCSGEASLEDTQLFTHSNEVHPELPKEEAAQ